jgi:hypothetical protein
LKIGIKINALGLQEFTSWKKEMAPTGKIVTCFFVGLFSSIVARNETTEPTLMDGYEQVKWWKDK